MKMTYFQIFMGILAILARPATGTSNGQIVGPILHQLPSPIQMVGTAIGRLDLVGQILREGLSATSLGSPEFALGRGKPCHKWAWKWVRLLIMQFFPAKTMQAGGAGGIRTLDTLLTYTHFPGERLRPLGHRSASSLEAGSLARSGGFRKPMRHAIMVA